jgi:peptidoglycan hydrolase-like protein with peptidoglycan-binding domain
MQSDNGYLGQKGGYSLTILNRTLGLTRVSVLLLCLTVAGEAIAERTVASMGELHATVSDKNWCGPIVQIGVAAPTGSQLNANLHELKLLTGGVRQILTLECPGIQELQLTVHVGGQVEGYWRSRSDSQLMAMAPPTSSGNTASRASSTWHSEPSTPAQVAQAQSLLKELGYQPGPADGLIGQRTRNAIATFRLDRQLPHSDAVNSDLIAQLRLARCGNPASCDPGGSAMVSAQVPGAYSSKMPGKAMSSSSMPLSQVTDNTEQKVGQSFENTRIVPECDDRDVYLQVMAAARQLPEPYSNWTLRGSTGDKIEIERGICSMELLFVTGHPEGLMTRVNITYTTDGDVSITNINAIKTPSEDKTKLLLEAESQSTVYGVVGPEEPEWFYFDVMPGNQVHLEVGPDFRPVAATVIGVGDMRQKFSFIATETRYEFLVAQLFRSVSDEEFWVRVEIE